MRNSTRRGLRPDCWVRCAPSYATFEVLRTWPQSDIDMTPPTLPPPLVRGNFKSAALWQILDDA